MLAGIPMVATFNFGLAPTELGPIALVFRSRGSDSSRPVALFIHGFLRDAGDLLHWHDILDPDLDVVFAELPGHGRSPPEGDGSIAALAQRLGHVIRSVFAERRVVVIGASIGGLVALTLADGDLPQVVGVIAGDPPLATAKQWPVRIAMRRHPGRAGPYLTEFADAVFGAWSTSPGDGRIYYALIGKVAVPSLILTGDVPLWPPRELPWPHRSLNDIPNLMDDADISVIGLIGNPRVTLQRISGCGHLVLSEGAAASVPLVREFCRSLCGLEPRHSSDGNGFQRYR